MYVYTRSLELKHFGSTLQKDITYITCNRLICCNGSYYVDETDELKHEDYELESGKTMDDYGFLTRHFSMCDYSIYGDNGDIWSSDRLGETFCLSLQRLSELWRIPPFITIRPKPTISLREVNRDITGCHISLTGCHITIGVILTGMKKMKKMKMNFKPCYNGCVI